MSEIVGRSLTLFTVKRNVVLSVAPERSVTVTVIVAVPYAFASGVNVIVQFGDVPDFAIVPLVINNRFDELIVTQEVQFTSPVPSASVIVYETTFATSSFVV